MLKFSSLDRRSGDLVEGNPCLCRFGITEAVIPAIAGLLGSGATIAGTAIPGLGIGTAAAGDIASVLGPALTHAGVGAGLGALTGNPGMGALLGGVSGGLGPLAKVAGLGSGALSGSAGMTIPAVVGPMQSTMDDGSVITSPGGSSSWGAPGAAGMSASPAAAAQQSPLASLGSKSGNGISGPLAILAALAQNANRPATTAPGAATANQPWNPSGYLNRTLTPNYAPAPGTSYYNYGSAPQPQFYSGNQLNLTPHMSHGGALSREMAVGRYAKGGALSHGNEFSTGGGQNYVQGAGNGQSDEIPAKLSDGEFVMDAGSVSRLGAGSSEAGARGMDAIRRAIDDDTKSDGVVMRKPQSPLHYAEIGKRAARAA